MARIVRGILGAIGDTPLVELNGLIPDFESHVFAKVERFNPGGSIKDRSAASMLLDMIRDGRLVPGRSTVVESSSGNLAIGIAQICRYYGLKFVCVVDAKTTEQNINILKAFNAIIDVVTEPDETGEYLPVRLRRVRELVATIPDAYWPNQYANPLNPAAHENTMREIAEALNGRVDYVFCPTSTCGTLTGASRYVRQHKLATTVVAVDAVGSVLFADTPGRRLIPGHGASVRPALLDPAAADEVVHVTDLECVVGCRQLIGREAILAGGSSGAVVAALDKMRKRIPPGSNCVLVFPDGGDRYLDTIYSDDWVQKHFGEVTHLWKESTEIGVIRC
ncbi:MAG TPA: 2,3-diaminopropionate biosynthesis protein SbnA [Jiangellales bacterium]|nr:2,3-diaminopropionate biosynthesis protein SbnA [Jiangellales bacterium]